MGSRGPGLLAYLRKQALLTNTGEAACMVAESLKAIA
jgi:hypothetical protein